MLDFEEVPVFFDFVVELLDFDCVEEDMVGFDNECGCGCKPEEPEPTDPVCGGLAGWTCDADEYCDYYEDTGDSCGFADGLGECKKRPEGCYALYAPVCGCDGVTYGNDCEANAAGTDVWIEGACSSP